MQGILLALVPIFAWGSIGLVAYKFGGVANQQTLGMTLGAFVFALIVFLLRMPTLTWQIFLIGYIGGLLGVFAFHEWTKQIQFILGFIAMAVLIVGFYFSAKRDPENAVVEEGRNYTKGL
ncbi:GRP family sugar transporter, partial [Leuconostoc mesenteroides]|uniref:GRP family sugar transporter n=1 Tax=Leuconostoc mesenteroides TaxID=1245 RepID=UPI002362D836